MELWEQATKLHTEGNYADAEKLYDAILTQNPFNSGLLATMGTLFLQTQRHGLAIAMLEHAIKIGPRQGDMLSNLGLAYKYSGQQDKAVKMLEEAVKNEPSAPSLANYSALFVENGEDEKCRTICKRAIDLDPSHPIAHWNLALTQLANGEWATAWDEAEWGMVRNVMRVDRDIGHVPFWKGEPGRVCVYGEQGIGDEIMFASMLPDILKTNEVVFESHTRLKTLFENSFPGLKIYGTREDRKPTWPENEPFDYRLSIGSLGKFYRRSAEAFPGTPYLKTDGLVKSKKMRVGISWTGGQKQGRIQKRSVPLSWWKPILNVPNVEFVSLQYTDCKEELDLMRELGYDIKVMDEYVKAEDYNETARLVASCDLVISVCTSVIHLAGALGVPCWIMTPKHPAWRYQNSGKMPFYRSVRLYRQPENNQDSWVGVVKQIGSDLRDLKDSIQQKAA